MILIEVTIWTTRTICSAYLPGHKCTVSLQYQTETISVCS